MLKSAKVSLVLLLLIFTFAPELNLGQVEMDFSAASSQSPFMVDFAAFRLANSDQVRLEVYYKIFNNHLSFVKKDDAFVADYEIQVKVLGKNKRQVSGNSISEKFTVSFYKETLSPVNFIINQLDLSTPSGQYKLEVTLIDKNSQETSTSNFSLKIPDYREKNVTLSGVEFAQEISDTALGTKFDKQDKKIIPKVERLFAGEDQKLWFYYEIYKNKPHPAELEITYEIIDFLQRQIHQETEKLQLEQPSLRLVKSLSLENLSPNPYTLLIRIKEKGGPNAYRKEDFQIEWSPAFYVKSDFKTALEHLRYVANEEEIKKLKKAPQEDQIKKWEEFWKSKDPVPETPFNELKEQYYQRMKYANLHFKTYSKEGWKTDMGMVYIKYGRPDEVDRHPFDREEKAFQIWHYYELRRIFTFVHNFGNGEYELQYPYDGDIRKIPQSRD